MHKYVISVVSPDTESAIEDMRTAAPTCDLLELRLDCMRDADLPRLLSSAPKPVIATCRPVHEGGSFRGTEKERLTLLAQAARLGAKYVDIELESVPAFEPSEARLIISHHDFNSVPDNISEIHQRICALEPAVAKLACMAKGAQDNLKMLLLNRKSPVPTAAFCMGPIGLPSRVLGRKYGSCFTYASLDASSPAAPGQVSLAMLDDCYRIRRIRSRTAVYGILGNPALHSLGPAFHNAAFEALGRNAVYVPFETADADAFWSAFAGEIQGLSITTPFKRKALEFARKLSPEAQMSGAVNTLVRTRGGFAGYNTDIEGVRKPLLSRLGSLDGKRVLVLGAGGAAAAALYAVTSCGARAFVSNRTDSKAESLVFPLGATAVPWDGRSGLACDVVINATTVGLRGEDKELVPPEFFKPGMVAFDLVYHRGGTSFLSAAAEAGAATIDGVEMFLAQAVEQSRLWTGSELPPELLSELSKNIRESLA